MSISEPTVVKSIGYNGNAVIYMSTSIIEPNMEWTVPAKKSSESSYANGEECEINDISLSINYTETQYNVSDSPCIYVPISIAAAGGIAFYNHPAEPWGIFSYTNLSAQLQNASPLMRIAFSSSSFNVAVNLTACSYDKGVCILNSIKDALSVAALVLPSPFDVGTAIASLLIPSGVAKVEFKSSSIGDGVVYEHFISNPSSMKASGSSFAVGSLLDLRIPVSSAKFSGASLTIVTKNDVYCKNGGAVQSFSLPIDPTNTIQGYLESSGKGNYLGDTPIFLKDTANGIIYEVTTVKNGLFTFYANHFTNK